MILILFFGFLFVLFEIVFLYIHIRYFTQVNFLNEELIPMDDEKKWMLMTYYCPTHGDPSIVVPY